MHMAEMPRGRLCENEPMARHVSWRAGGAARRAFFPVDRKDLATFMHTLPRDEAVLMVGLGSNLLVRDGGFAGTVIFTHGTLAGLSRLALEDDGTVYAEAGVATPKLARFAANHAFAEAEFFAGIPGTVGGALAMNAGCHGGEIWRYVTRVMMMNRQAECVMRTVDHFEIGYRHVRPRFGEDEIFAAAWFRFPRGQTIAARGRIRELLARRIATQPLGLPNAGSVFRNPPGDHAARLIEAAGLKGVWSGGAQVSEKHANFIVNPDGKATANEIEMLIDKIRFEVNKKFAVQLVPEVRIVGKNAVGKNVVGKNSVGENSVGENL
ncbi:MAG: UDP-N-acetylmuramate dehydrogenase [Rugosibacter sp.]|nr:MAG: UDP-N-acetylmuramate dehydrogenase [Rugosibacter sp.]